MEQKDIDIYEILKGMPDGTKLYTKMCGEVEFTCLTPNKEAGKQSGLRIRTENIPSTITADGWREEK